MIFSKRVIKFKVTALVLLAALLVFLLKPIRTDDSIAPPDPALLAGKQQFLKDTPPSTLVKRPNIVILLADDLGKTDISLYGGPVPTPHIDSLAAAGVAFSAGYVTAPICSPSRAGLLTGRYQERFGYDLQPGDHYPMNRLEIIGGNALFSVASSFRFLHGDFVGKYQTCYPTPAAAAAQGLPLSELTFAELAKTQGYATAIIGKWHLGSSAGQHPLERGFDYHFGFYGAATMYAPAGAEDMVETPYSDRTGTFLWLTRERQRIRDGQPVEDNAFLTERLAEESVAFIEQHRDRPFLLYVPFNAPHTPFHVPKEYYDRFPNERDETKRVYYGMIGALDDAIGKITQKVHDAGLEENTLFFFASDNGGAAYTGVTDNKPLKGGKLAHFEGGVNVPFVMSWPGKVTPGRQYRDPVISLDIFATIAKALEAPLPQDREYDGVDLVDAVNRGGPAHEALYWRAGGSKAIRKGTWKLVISAYNGNKWLYDLSNDISEADDVKARHPEIVTGLEADLARWESHNTPCRWISPAYNRQRFGDSIYFFDI